MSKNISGETVKRVLITGANRGIGLGFVKTYLQQGYEVVACCRKPSEANALQVLKQEWPTLCVLKLDVTSEIDIANLKMELKNRAIDLLINNAGVYECASVGEKSPVFGELNFQDWQRIMNINCIGPILIAQALYANLKMSEQSKVIAISSRAGSIKDNQKGSFYSYRSSKAALNASMRSLSIDLKPDGIACAVFSPGWVQTDMGSTRATITVEESVRGLVSLIDQLTLKQTGSFWSYDGSEIAW